MQFGDIFIKSQIKRPLYPLKFVILQKTMGQKNGELFAS